MSKKSSNEVLYKIVPRIEDGETLIAYVEIGNNAYASAIKRIDEVKAILSRALGEPFRPFLLIPMRNGEPSIDIQAISTQLAEAIENHDRNSRTK